MGEGEDQVQLALQLHSVRMLGSMECMRGEVGKEKSGFGCVSIRVLFRGWYRSRIRREFQVGGRNLECGGIL